MALKVGSPIKLIEYNKFLRTFLKITINLLKKNFNSTVVKLDCLFCFKNSEKFSCKDCDDY